MLKSDRNDIDFRAILAICLIVPLVFWPRLYVVFSAAKLALFFIGVAFLLLVRASKKKWEFSPRPLVRNYDWLLALFFVLVGVSTLAAKNPELAFFGNHGRYDGFITYLAYLVVFLSAAQIKWSPAKYRLLFGVIAAGAIVISGYGILQSLGLDPIKWPQIEFESFRAFSTFGNPIILGTFLALALPFCLALAVESDAGYRRLGRLSSVLVTLALISTFSRGGWIGGLIGAISYYLLFRRSSKVLVSRTPTVATALIAVIVFAVVGLVLGFSSDVFRRGGSVVERALVWKIGLEMVKERPLTGSGPDNFRLAFQRHDTLSRAKLVSGRKLIDNAHNFPLQLATTMGVPAVLALFSWLALLFRQALLCPGPDIKTYKTAIIAGLIGFLTSLLFAVNSVGTGVLFWVILGSVRGGLSVEQEKSRQLNRITAMTARAVTALLAGFFITWSILLVLADYNFAVAKNLSGQGFNQSATYSYEQAVALNPYVGAYLTDFGLFYLNNALASRNENAYRNSINLFKRAVLSDPGESDNHMLLGQALMFYGLNKDKNYLPAAENHLKKSIELWPYGAANNYLLGYTYLNLNDKSAAVPWLKKALAIAPGFQDARQALGLALSPSRP